MLLEDSVDTIPFVGTKAASLLSKLEIHTIYDLLFHIPNYYKDLSKISQISELDSLTPKTIQADVLEIKNIRLRGRKSMQSAILEDDSGRVIAVWFNQPYLVDTLADKTAVLFTGKLNPKQKKPQLSSPQYEITREDQEAIHMARITPVYALTKGITLKWLRSRLKWLIENLHKIDNLQDNLEKRIIDNYKLISRDKAIKLIHFPANHEHIVESRRRLAFDELLEIQFKLLLERKKRYRQLAPKINEKYFAVDKFINTLPFKLTLSQTRAYNQIYADYMKKYPMRRLIQGDVGSGKTIVAVLSALPVVKSGKQVAVLAPTSVLARQLYDNFRSLVPTKYSVELITGKSREIDTKQRVDILVGTHALLHRKDKLLSELGLVIIDEQHRFGVNQRRELLNLNNTDTTKPHLLYLTATPIPRTVAQSLFGDLDVTEIARPSNRKLVETFLVPENKRQQSYNWIETNLISGGQVFWIFPLIEENEELARKSVEVGFAELCKRFSDYKIGLLHGKIKDKDKIIANFRNKKYDILVSTTVIEVGIDIPQANLIVIESAESFGLAQLHQLRGRVGRAGQDAWCLLFTENEKNIPAISRLKFFAQEKSGIKIAEFDLQRRGPGEVYGTAQSGIPELKVASFSNLNLLEETREAAKLILGTTVNL